MPLLSPSRYCDAALYGHGYVAIDGPVAVALGAARQPPPAGYMDVKIDFVQPVYRDMSCIPDGEWRDYAGAECCTNTKHYAPSLGHYVCGP